MTPEPKVANLETGEVRKDRATGQTVYVVGVCAMRGRDSSVVQVSVAGEPQGLVLGGSVRVVDLEAVPWDRDGRSGVSWRASAVVPVDTSAAEPAAPVVGASGGRRSTASAGAAGPFAPLAGPSGRGGEAQ